MTPGLFLRLKTTGEIMKLIKLFILFSAFSLNFAQTGGWNFAPDKVPDQPVNEFQAFAYFFNQMVHTDVYAANDLLKGQIVGRLFSNNTTTTGEKATYFEQRLIPFFIYQPKLLDGRALLRTSFEIDWTWGDASYGVGGNYGSSFSADQVNIQTQNVEVELIPYKTWAVNLGLQRLFDTPYNPYRTSVSTMTNTGYRLMYWGSDGVGVTLRKDANYWRAKAGFYQLYENNVHQFDDVTLTEAIFEHDVTPAWRQGYSFWYVYDRANGEGGVSILGQGLKSLLNDYNGVYKFNELTGAYRADVFWVGTYANYNPEYRPGRLSINAFAVANFGTIKVDNKKEFVNAVTIGGVGANLKAGYRYGQTDEDIVSMDIFYASGDGDAAVTDAKKRDERYRGVLTGNMWGSPGGLNITSGAYLLYPHGNVVNRYIAAIADLSNAGFGQLGGTLNFHKSIIPNKLSAKVGIAAAKSEFKPVAGGDFIGGEVNARIAFIPAVFMNIEVHAAYMWLGDFYDSPNVNGKAKSRPQNPYTVFAVFKWLMF